VGLVKALIRRAGPGPTHLVLEPLQENFILMRAATIGEARAICDELDIGWLENLALGTDTDIFMEVLLNAIKNDVISYQSFVSKSKKNALRSLTAEIQILKGGLHY
jgi:hypothetical protein